MSLEGKITLTLYPPNYGQSQSLWSSHPDLSVISELLGTNLVAEDDIESDAEEDLLKESSDESEENCDAETKSKPVISNKFGALATFLENE